METKLSIDENVINPKSNVGLVVEWFLNQDKMSHKKIQKLCFYSQVWSLITLNESIVPNIEFEAWVHGPVNRETYNRCRNFKWRDIMISPDCKEKSIKEIESFFTSTQKEVLRFVWDVYGNMSADELESMTHSEEPWIKARSGVGKFENSDKVITVDSIKEYYGEKFKSFIEC